jgi:streptomycin 6-kinase
MQFPEIHLLLRIEAEAAAARRRPPVRAEQSSGSAPLIVVPAELVAWHEKFFGEAGHAWLAALPTLAAECLDRWRLRIDGRPNCGAVALVVPVLRDDGTPAVLKLQPIDDETVGEPLALRTWNGNGAVRLLEHDPASGSMVLERLDASRSLASIADDLAALEILCGILVRLCAGPAPEGVRHLRDIAAGLLDRLPYALSRVADRNFHRLLASCGSATAELVAEPGDRLLHFDLHFGNVLAAFPEQSGEREPWLAIDPKPLAGDPGFELLAALHNRWDEVVATGDVPRAVHRRFDLMTEVLGLDRERSTGWTLARILLNALWDIENDTTSWHTEPDKAVARALLDR